MKLLIKLGGALLDSAEARESIARQIASLPDRGHQAVVVHGGGKQLSRYLAAQGFKSEFRSGFRVTPPEILEAVVRILAGNVNHSLVAALGKHGARAVGLTGIDAGLVRAVQLSGDLGAVGRVEQIDTALLELLTARQYLPVVACLAGGFQGEIYNVNADQMAVACAAGFAADRLVFLTDVEGVLDGDSRLLPRLSLAEAEALIAQGVARGGMEAKLNAAMAAVQGGVPQVRIIAGGAPGAIDAVLSGEVSGTILTP